MRFRGNEPRDLSVPPVLLQNQEKSDLPEKDVIGRWPPPARKQNGVFRLLNGGTRDPPEPSACYS